MAPFTQTHIHMTCSQRLGATVEHLQMPPGASAMSEALRRQDAIKIKHALKKMIPEYVKIPDAKNVISEEICSIQVILRAFDFGRI